jgi:hypothetical protein
VSIIVGRFSVGRIAGLQNPANPICCYLTDDRIGRSPKRHLKYEATAIGIDYFDAVTGGPDVKNTP